MLYVAIVGRSAAAVILSDLISGWINRLPSLSLSISEMFPSSCSMIDELQGFPSIFVDGEGGAITWVCSCFSDWEGGNPPPTGFPDWS